MLSVEQRGGLESLLFKLLDIEVNPFLIRDIHDILNSLLCSSLNEKTLKRWLFLLRDIAISAEADTSISSTEQSVTSANTPAQRKNNKKEKNTNEDDDDDEDYDDSQTFSTSKKASSSISSSGGFGSGNASSFNSTNIRMKQITKLISPKWPNR